MIRDDPHARELSYASAAYVLGIDEVLLMMTCSTSGARPDGGWLSIAETIEFLPFERRSSVGPMTR